MYIDGVRCLLMLWYKVTSIVCTALSITHLSNINNHSSQYFQNMPRTKPAMVSATSTNVSAMGRAVSKVPLLSVIARDLHGVTHPKLRRGDSFGDPSSTSSSAASSRNNSNSSNRKSSSHRHSSSGHKKSSEKRPRREGNRTEEWVKETR